MQQQAGVPGSRIGRYLLRDRIGAGGMGIVYTAVHERAQDRLVALKLLVVEEHLERFRREVTIMRRFDHPNIIPLFDFVELRRPLELWTGQQATAFLVMPYLPEGSLAKRLEDAQAGGWKMALDDITRILRALTSALDYAHQRDVIHRDIKPSNILFHSDGRAVLTDFGIALPAGLPRLTATGEGIGTIEYASPEQFEGKGIGPASDIYSLGLVLYEMVTNELPWRVDNPYQWLSHHLYTPRRPAADFRADLPEAAEEVLARALAKRPQARFQSGTALLQAWRASLGETVSVPSDETRPLPAAPLVFVGRERETQVLWTALRRARRGQPGTVLIDGDAGIGKTALVDRFALQASSQYPGLLVAQGEGLPESLAVDTPFYPFGQIFEQVIAQLSELGTRFEPETLKWRMPKGLKMFLRILGRCAPAALDAFCPPLAFGVDVIEALLQETPAGDRLKDLVVRKTADAEAGHALTPPQVLARTLDSSQGNVTTLTTQYAQAMVELSRERPMLLVVDALEQIDECSWQLLEELDRLNRSTPGRILLVGCLRSGTEASDVATKTLARLTARGTVLTVGQDEPPGFVTRFLQANYGHYDFDGQFVERLADHTGANPRFLEETLSYLDEQGLLTLEQQRRLASRPAFDALRLPVDVSALLKARVGVLTDLRRWILQHASVQGMVFIRQVLAATLYTSPPSPWKGDDAQVISARVGDELTTLPNLVTLDPPAYPVIRLGRQRLTRHVFCYGLLRDYLYGLWDAETKRLIHHWVGQALEQLYGARTDAVAPQLAYHFDRSREDPWRAMHYAHRVAQVLYNRYCMPAVHLWCDLALKAAQELADRGLDPEPVDGLTSPEELAWQVRELKGDAFYFEADWLKAREQYTLLLDHLPATPTDASTLNRTAEMLRKIGETWRGEADWTGALDQFRRALALLEGNPLATPAQIAVLHREIGYILAQEREAGPTEEALEHYHTALERVEGDPQEWALAASLYTCHGCVYEQAVELDEGAEQPTPEQRELLSKALDWHEKAIESRGKPLSPESDLARDRLGLAGVLSNRAIVYEKLRDWGRCEADHLEAIRLLTEVGHVVGIAMARLNYGEMLRQQGRDSEAAEQYRASLMAFIRVGDRFGELIDHFNLSLVEASEPLRQGHAFRGAMIAALDERWWWLAFVASTYLDRLGEERERASQELDRFLTGSPSEFSFPPAMTAYLAPSTDDDRTRLAERAGDAAWVARVRDALSGAALAE